MTSGNSNDDVRRHNLSVVLELVHRQRGLARAVLTRETGLNRSTTGALVSELVDLCLVVESEPAREAGRLVGRPSPVVSANPNIVAFAVNPEIDAITVAIIGLDATLRARIRRPVDRPTVAEAVLLTVAIIDELLAQSNSGYRVVAIGVAVPGLVRTGDGLIRLAPHLGWLDEPFAALLSQATGLPVSAANDADLGILAESIFGAGKDVVDLIYLNGGASGIGGGIIAGGQVVRGSAGYAGELGHTLVNTAGVTCHCGASGCLETEVRRAPLLALVGVTDSDELEAALVVSDSAEVMIEVRRQLDFLAVALRNAINILNPQLVILGGFLGSLSAAAPGYLIERVTAQTLTASRESVTITRSELGPNLLMIGAAELAFEALLADPAGYAVALAARAGGIGARSAGMIASSVVSPTGASGACAEPSGPRLE